MTQISFQIDLNPIKDDKGLIVFFSFHNSLMINATIHQILFGYFDLSILLFLTINSGMKTTQTGVNNLTN